MSPRILAVFLSVLFVATALAPLAAASTEPTHNGDVVINGAFADARPVGYPTKFYCDAYNPTPVEGPGGECASQNQFFAYDWTTPVEMAANVTLVEGGVRIQANSFIQQHFNGSDAPDRAMQLFHVKITGSASQASSNNLRVEIRADGTSYSKLITVPTTTTTIDLTAASLGISSGLHNLRSVRLWGATGSTDITLSRVSVYATNGIEARNLNIVSGGDDILTSLDGASLLNAGADGKYTFLVGMAADNGDFLPARDATLCLYTFEQAMADRGFPNNVPVYCAGAYLKSTSPAITKTRVGEAFRFDIAASAVQPTTGIPAFAVYAIVEIDGSYDIETPTAGIEAKSGYYNAMRVAADALGAGVSQEYFAPTPLFIDANADGKPDYVSTQDMDGHSVIITPQLATTMPALTVVTTDVNGDYLFDIQVYKYDGATGAPMDLPGSISLGLFDATSVVNGGSGDATPFWRTDDHGSQLSRIDAKTWRVTVPASEISTSAPIGAWAFYNVGGVPVTNVFGRSTSSTDFYSGVRNTVKEFAVADTMRAAMTPILLDSSSLTRDATFVVRVDPSVDDLTPLDGTLVAGDKGDGSITFEYAMVIPEGRTVTLTGTSHGLALYDAAGIASDDFAPGTSGMEHALWNGQGVRQSDGWFRVDVPVSAFQAAKGSVGAWGWTDTTTGVGSTLSRSGWYNLLKPAAASISTSAAELALYAPTPIVLMDAQLGIPQMLASAINGAGSDIISLQNPLVNPGFEADLLIEARRDTTDNTGAVITSPPWFLRLDDKGTGQPTNPKSTHTVVAGKGTLATHALSVNYNKLDNTKGLMLGQLLGSELAGDVLVWNGATSVSLDAQLTGPATATLTGTLRYLDNEGVVRLVESTKIVSQSGIYKRLSFPLSVPADGRLLGFYLVISGTQSTSFLLDNVVLAGSQTALGDARSDLTDGYSVIIDPVGLSGTTQGLVQGADGKYYVYHVQVVDYTQGTARTLDLAGMSRAFALRTEELQLGGGIMMELRSGTDSFVALVPEGDTPAPLAAPWAYVAAGGQYTNTLGVVNQPASGHYNPIKNALKGLPLADQLDYAATPIAFGTNVIQTQTAPQSIRLTPVTGGYAAIVAVDSPYVETTTLTVTRPDAAPATYTVRMSQTAGDLVPGLILSVDDLKVSTLTSAATRFTTGARLIAGSPVANFEVCRPAQATCLDAGILTGEVLGYHSTSLSPTGEPLTLVWSFGDGAVTTQTSADTTHAYTRPGTKTVNLTVQTPSGKRASVEQVLTVNNRAPVIAGIDITPAAIYQDSVVNMRARASDADGGVLSYAWTLDGVNVPGVTSATFKLTPSILDATTGVAALQKRVYAVGVSVTDGQGGVTSGASTFTVGDRPTQVSRAVFTVTAAPSATYALPGDVLSLSVFVSDGDDTPSSVTLDYTTPARTGTLSLVAVGGGFWAGTLDAIEPGQYTAVATAHIGGGADTSGALGAMEVREDSAPLVSIVGSNLTDVGATRIYTVTASDPDGRGIASYALSGVTVLAQNGSAFTVRFDAMGITTLSASVQDLSGATGSATLSVTVDDAILVTMTMFRAAQNATEGHLLKIVVTGSDGIPRGGASIVVEDFYDIIPRALETKTVTADADGIAIVSIRAEGVLLGLPLSRHVIATASTPSLAGAPVQDIETASATLALRNTAGPLGGLPLP